MNLVKLATREVRANPLASLLAVVLLALGIATLVVLMLFVEQIDSRFTRDARGIDLVVGAKGSPMQLILSGIYHLDAPTGNIPLAEAEKLKRHPMIRKAMPLALGDSFKGYRIVGATPEYLAHYEARLRGGRLYEEPMEAVLGAAVAKATGLGVGGQFVGSHGIAEGGHAHEDDPYEVVGVLQRTDSPLDQLVLTPVESVWWVHAGHGASEAGAEDEDFEAAREVTVVLLQYASPLAAASMPRLINQTSALQAASPAFETARLMRLIGVGRDVLNAFAGLLVAASAAALLAALYATLRTRRYDVAVMRMLGASRGTIFSTLILESLLLTSLGALLGIGLGHLLAAGLGAWLAAAGQPTISGAVWVWSEAWLLPLAWFIGVVAALIPALQAARLDVAPVLARG